MNPTGLLNDFEQSVLSSAPSQITPLLAHLCLNVPQRIVFNTDWLIRFTSVELIFYVSDEFWSDFWSRPKFCLSLEWLCHTDISDFWAVWVCKCMPIYVLGDEEVWKVLILWICPFKSQKSSAMNFTELISQRKLAKAYWINLSLSNPKIEHSGLCYQHGTAHLLITWQFPEDRIVPGWRQCFFSLLLINMMCI